MELRVGFAVNQEIHARRHSPLQDTGHGREGNLRSPVGLELVARRDDSIRKA